MWEIILNVCRKFTLPYHILVLGIVNAMHKIY